MTEDEMEQLTAHTKVKSEKIRILFRAGVERADIARFIGISYQHVQNVLKRSKLLGGSTPTPRDVAVDSQVYTVNVGPGGKITLPAEYIDKHKISQGEILICREEAGGLTIMSREAATDVLREVARQRMPGEAALLEALLGNRTQST